MPEPQRIVTLRVDFPILRSHPQRVRAGRRVQGPERRLMRFVALDAPPARLHALALVPEAVGPAVRAMLPIAEHRAVAFRAYPLRLVPRDFASAVVGEGVAES